MMLAWPHALAPSSSGCLGLGCRRLGSKSEAEGLGLTELSCCLSLVEASLSFLSQCSPPSAPAPPVGVHRGEVVDNLCINLSAWGLLVRWCLSGFRSCQMGLPEPVGKGGGFGRSHCCRAWRLPHHPQAFTSPRPPAGCLLYHIRIQNIA